MKHGKSAKVSTPKVGVAKVGVAKVGVVGVTKGGSLKCGHEQRSASSREASPRAVWRSAANATMDIVNGVVANGGVVMGKCPKHAAFIKVVFPFHNNH